MCGSGAHSTVKWKNDRSVELHTLAYHSNMLVHHVVVEGSAKWLIDWNKSYLPFYHQINWNEFNSVT